MADNFVANLGAGGDTFAADEVGVAPAVKFPRTKLSLGADGAFDGDVSASNPMPVTGPLTDGQLRAAAVPVSAAALPLPAGAATEATLSAVSGKLPAALGQTTMAASISVMRKLNPIMFERSSTPFAQTTDSA